MFHQTKNSFLISLILILSLTILGFLIFHKNDASATNSTCTDSDNGKNYYLAGEVNYGKENFQDECTYNAKALDEFYCYGDSWGHMVVKCSGGCENGMCLGEAQPLSCIDEDGGLSIYESSIAHTEYGGGQYDCCLETINSSCSDTGKYIKEALCKDDPSLGEFSYTHQILECPYGCQSDRCLAEKQNLHIITPDGGEEFKGGETYEIQWENPENDINRVNIALYDIVDYSKIIAQKIVYDISMEQDSYSWTIPNNIESGYYLIKVWNADKNAHVGSYDYTDDVFYIEQSVKTCVDSDDGKNQYVRGSTTGRKLFDDNTIITKTDYCASMGSNVELDNCSGDDCGVYEFSCDSTNDQTFVNGVFFSCSHGCENGACKAGIDISAPQSGEKWLQDNAYFINWDIENLEDEEIDIYLCAFDVSGHIVEPKGREDELVNYCLPIFEDIPAVKKQQEWLIPEDINSLFSETPFSYKIKIFHWDKDKTRIVTADTSDGYFSIMTGQFSNFLYPLDGDIIHTLNPQFITINIEKGNQIGIWQGEQILSEEQFLTWINAVPGERGTSTSQEGPVGQFEWNQTYTAGIRKCNDDSFTNCSDWLDSVTFTIEPGDSVYESDDGKDYYTPGYIDIDGEMMTDNCLHEIRSSSDNTNMLIEYYVTGEDSNPVDSIHYSCPNGCKDGACNQEQEKSLKIIYPNNREKIQKGLINLIKWESQEIDKVNIELQKGDRVWHLADNVPASSGKYFWDVSTDFEDDSDYKVTILDVDDATIKDSSDNYFSIVSVGCADTDNGDNSYEKGKVTCNGEFHEDFCNVNGKLVEWLCESGKAISFLGSCKNGCSEGKCLKKPSGEKININIWAKIQTNDVSGKHVRFFSDYHDTTTICEFMLISPDGFMLGNGAGGCYDNLGEGFAAIPLENLKAHAERFDFQYAGTWTYRVYLPKYDQTIDANFIITSDTSSDDEIVADVCLPDGSLIKVPNSSKIYVIQDCQKKWIKTQEEFQQSDYKWQEVQKVPSSIMNNYADYLETQANLLRKVNDPKVYRIIHNKKLFIPNIATFEKQRLRWSDVKAKPSTTIDQYERAKLLKSKKNNKIYYITESGLKRQVLNSEVFLSYGNRWEDVIEIDEEVINSYENVNLIRTENGYDVYYIENGVKRIIETPQAFNKKGYDWSKIAPVNLIELNAYSDGEPVK